ncbi:MAG: arylamine N-acetyltransferase [Deltaproteobacteria bacterium]|nr:arylamine N-acetyltransferase [Deltaproteobacteria bacterium]
MKPGELDAYLNRIGYAGERAPSVEVLGALMDAHVRAIPFENLDVLAGRSISLEPDDLMEKLVHRHRGGYCFEHHGLFERVLDAIGFEVEPLAARVRIKRARDEIPPRTHVCLAVQLGQERWLVDVGVGGLSSTGPIRFVADVEQATPHEPRRLLREDDRWWHQARLGDEWIDVAELTGERMPRVDREIANWFTSTHPSSVFRKEAMVARALPSGGRLTLRGNALTRRENGNTERQELATEAEIDEALRSGFGLRA